METKLILDRIEFNYKNFNNNEISAARLYLKKNFDEIKDFLEKINNRYAISFVKEIFSEKEKDQFGQPQIVNIGREDTNYKTPSFLINVKNIKLTEKKEEDIIGMIEVQSLIFKVYNSNFDKYITFKFKRNWKIAQGILEEKSYNFFNILLNKLLNNKFIIKAEIRKDKKTNYYLINKIL